MRVAEANWTFESNKDGSVGRCSNLSSRDSTLMQMELQRLGIGHECKETPIASGSYTITVTGSAADEIHRLSLLAQAEAYKGR